MSVRITNPKTVDLVRRLAAELGVGPTKAIEIAVNAALAKERDVVATDDEWRIRDQGASGESGRSPRS